MAVRNCRRVLKKGSGRFLKKVWGLEGKGPVDLSAKSSSSGMSKELQRSTNEACQRDKQRGRGGKNQLLAV